MYQIKVCPFYMTKFINFSLLFYNVVALLKIQKERIERKAKEHEEQLERERQEAEEQVRRLHEDFEDMSSAPLTSPSAKDYEVAASRGSPLAVVSVFLFYEL